jgi:hypothetical protein
MASTLATRHSCATAEVVRRVRSTSRPGWGPSGASPRTPVPWNANQLSPKNFAKKFGRKILGIGRFKRSTPAPSCWRRRGFRTGKRVATHWTSRDRLADRFPALKAIAGRSGSPRRAGSATPSSAASAWRRRCSERCTGQRKLRQREVGPRDVGRSARNASRSSAPFEDRTTDLVIISTHLLSFAAC